MKNTILSLAMATILAVVLPGCQKELEIKSPGNLVPKTVDQDPTLPSISVNGTQLHSEAFGNPNDPMVVFLHGGPGCDYRNAYNVKQLTDDGYYVVFYDQRGSGLSQRHDRNSFSLQIILDDLTAVIANYRTSVNQKIFLMGHSWGAMLAAAYINSYPEKIRGTILLEPGGLTDEMIKEYGQLSRKIKLLSEATNDVIYSDQFLTGNANEHEILDYKMSMISTYSFAKDNIEGIEGPYPFWRHGAEFLQSMQDLADSEGFDFTTNLHNYTTEVLYLYSQNNQAYGLQHAQEIARYFSSVKLYEIAETGHEMIYFKWNSVYTVVLPYLNSLR